MADESVHDARCSLELGFFDLLDDDALEVAVNGEALEWASAERLSGGGSHAPLSAGLSTCRAAQLRLAETEHRLRRLADDVLQLSNRRGQRVPHDHGAD